MINGPLLLLLSPVQRALTISIDSVRSTCSRSVACVASPGWVFLLCALYSVPRTEYGVQGTQAVGESGVDERSQVAGAGSSISLEPSPSANPQSLLRIWMNRPETEGRNGGVN